MNCGYIICNNRYGCPIMVMLILIPMKLLSADPNPTGKYEPDMKFIIKEMFQTK